MHQCTILVFQETKFNCHLSKTHLIFWINTSDAHLLTRSALFRRNPISRLFTDYLFRKFSEVKRRAFRQVFLRNIPRGIWLQAIFLDDPLFNQPNQKSLSNQVTNLFFVTEYSIWWWSLPPGQKESPSCNAFIYNFTKSIMKTKYNKKCSVLRNTIFQWKLFLLSDILFLKYFRIYNLIFRLLKKMTFFSKLEKCCFILLSIFRNKKYN